MRLRRHVGAVGGIGGARSFAEGGFTLWSGGARARRWQRTEPRGASARRALSWRGGEIRKFNGYRLNSTTTTAAAVSTLALRSELGDKRS